MNKIVTEGDIMKWALIIMGTFSLQNGFMHLGYFYLGLALFCIILTS